MSSAPSPTDGASPAGLDLGSSYGVMLISTIIAAALYGFTVLQSLYYFEHFSKDPWLLKASVVVIWILDTLTIVLDSHMVYFYLIANFNNPPALGIEIWSTQAELLVTYTLVLIVQLFFIHRMLQLRPEMWYIPAFLGLLAIASYAMVLGIFAFIVHNSIWSDTGTPTVNGLLTANWVLGMVVDIGITVVLCWYLWSEKTVVRLKTNVMLNSIILFLVNRGAIAAAVQVLTLLTKFIWPQTLVYLAFHNGLSKVYTNSMLATLNARVALRKIIMDSQLDETRPPTTFASGRPGTRPVSKVPTVAVSVHQSHQISFASNPTLSSGHVAMFDALDSRIADTEDITEYSSYPPSRATGQSAHAFSQGTIRLEDEMAKGSFLSV